MSEFTEAVDLAISLNRIRDASDRPPRAPVRARSIAPGNCA